MPFQCFALASQVSGASCVLAIVCRPAAVQFGHRPVERLRALGKIAFTPSDFFVECLALRGQPQCCLAQLLGLLPMRASRGGYFLRLPCEQFTLAGRFPLVGRTVVLKGCQARIELRHRFTQRCGTLSKLRFAPGGLFV